MNMRHTVQGSLIWLITALFVIYGFSLNAALVTFADEIKLSLQTGDVGFSLVMGFYIAGFALMQIPAGYLLDKYNPRFVVSSAILLLAMGNIILAFTNDFYLVCFANFVQGLGSAFAFISAAVLIAQWFSKQMFPILLGLIETLTTIIAGLLHYFFVIKLTEQNWHDIYLYLFFFGIFLVLLAFLLIKTPTDYVQPKAIKIISLFKRIVSNKQIWLCSLAAATSFGVLLAYADLWYIPVQKFYAVEHKQSALIGSMFDLGIALGTPFLGWLSNFLKSRKLILHFSLVLGNMALLLALYLPHFPIDTLIIIKIVSFLTGFLLSGSMLFYTIVKEITHENNQGLGLSFINMIVFLFNSFMLLIPYVFVTSFSQEFFTYLWVLPFCVLFSILLTYFIKDPDGLKS